MVAILTFGIHTLLPSCYHPATILFPTPPNSKSCMKSWSVNFSMNTCFSFMYAQCPSQVESSLPCIFKIVSKHLLPGHQHTKSSVSMGGTHSTKTYIPAVQIPCEEQVTSSFEMKKMGCQKQSQISCKSPQTQVHTDCKHSL